MKLRSLSLRNFRRHAVSDIEFPDGVTAVVGPNGAGKSSLLEAVSFALFGTDALATSKHLLRHEAAGPGDAVSVVLQFELAGQGVEVLRELRGRNQTPNAQLSIDGTVIVPSGAGSSEAATGKIEQLLGMDRESFHTTVVARQNELSRLSDAKPADRKRLVLRMLGIERLDGAIENARLRRRDAESRLAALRSVAIDPAKLAQDLAGLDAKVNGHAAVVAQRTQHHKDAVTGLQVAEKALQAARDAHAQSSAAKQAVEAATRLAGAARQRLERAVAACEEVAKAAAEAERLRPLAEARSGLEAQWQEAQEAVAKARSRVLAQRRIEELERRRESAAKQAAALVVSAPLELAPLQQAHDAATQARIQAQAGREAAQRDARQLEERAARLQRLGADAPCPTCERPLAGHVDRLHAESRHQLEAARQQAHASSTAAAQADVALRAATVALDAGRRAQTESLRVAAEKASWEAAAAQAMHDLEASRRELPPEAPMPADLDELRRRREEASVSHDAFQRATAVAAGHERAQAEQSSAQLEAQRGASQLAQAQKALAQFAAADGLLREASRRVEAARLSERQAASGVERDQATAAGWEAARAAGAARLEEAQRLAASVRGLEVEAAEWSALASARNDGLLDRFRDHLVDRIGPAIQKEASRLLASFTGGRYTDLLLDADYEVFVVDGGTAYALERYSGGEQDLIHLALRLAVSRLLAQRSGLEVRLLALDEVFGALDAERRGHVIETLHALSGLYQQVLVVSHLESLQESLDQAIRVVPDGGSSRLEMQTA